MTLNPNRWLVDVVLISINVILLYIHDVNEITVMLQISGLYFLAIVK